MKKSFIIFGFIVVAGIGAYFYFSFRAEQNDVVLVEFMEVKKSPFRHSIAYDGTTMSRKMETVKSTRNGIILDKGFQNQDDVKAGTVIAQIKLEDEEYQKKAQELSLARIDLDLIQKQFDLAKELFAAKAIPERELKQARIQELKQQVQVDDLKKELEPQDLKSSFDAMLVNKRFNHLDRVFSGTELFTIIDVNALNVEVPVFQQDIGRLKIGQPVIFKSETFDSTREGAIMEISTVATQDDNRGRRRSAATFNVYCSIQTLSDDQTLFGSNISAEFVFGIIDSVFSVPLETVLYQEEGKIVYVLEEGRARIRTVETGEYNDTAIVIVSGLSEGEKVITRGNLDVEDGTLVTTEQKEEGRRRRFGFPFYY